MSHTFILIMNSLVITLLTEFHIFTHFQNDQSAEIQAYQYEPILTGMHF